MASSVVSIHSIKKSFVGDLIKDLSISLPKRTTYDGYNIPFDISILSEMSPISLCVFLNGSLHDEISIASSNEDGPLNWSTYKGSLSSIGLSLNFTLNFRVKFENGTLSPCLQISGNRQRALKSTDDGINPILLDGLARSGTTIAMAILSSHPDIVSYQKYPFEWRPAIYWAHMFQCLARPNRAVGGAWNWDFQSDRNRVPGFVYSDNMGSVSNWASDGYINDLAEFCKNSITSAYAAMSIEQDKKYAKYFIEKFAGINSRYFPDIFGKSTEILVIRDPRDVFCSVQAMNLRRGRVDFGIDRYKTPYDYLNYLCNTLKRYRTRMDYPEECLELMFIRYEDLMEKTHDTLRGLFMKLNLTHSDEILSACVEAMNSENTRADIHKTSNSKAGIGRWREELPAEITNRILDEHSDLLSYFDYS